MKVRTPSDAQPWMVTMIREINAALDKIDGANNRDYNGRRIINAGDAKDPGDYATLRDVGKVFESKMAIRDGAAARAAAQTAAASGSGEGGGGEYMPGTTPGSPGGAGSPRPTVPLPNAKSIIDAYAAAHPDQLANSCQPPYGSGTWEFMDGVVAALRASDDRFGYNAKRGNVDDPSPDAISYYHGEYATMTYGSIAVYVVDIIAGHCGTNPGTQYHNVTGVGGATARWLPHR